MDPTGRLVKIFKDEKGAAVVILALAFTVLAGSAALVADVGINYLKQARLSVAADAAALAGGTRLADGRQVAEVAAREMAVKNGVPLENVSVEVDADGKGITVRTRAPLQKFFAVLFASSEGQMEQRARVALTRPVAFYRVFPLGVERATSLTYGTEVELFSSLAQGSGSWGTLGFLDEDGKKYLSDNNSLKKVFSLGHTGLAAIDDEVEVSSGVKMDAVSTGVKYRFEEAAKTHQCSLGNCPPDCPRILILPIYEEILDNNKNKTGMVRIVDFAAFWIKSYQGQGANFKIYGNYIKPRLNAAASVEGESEYGLTTLKLVE